MVATTVTPAPAADAGRLGPDDVDDMLALVGRTHPGPFERRTIELGDYIGVRDEAGSLVAMAGMRMRAPGHTEISAVCTDEVARGRGLASALVRDLVGRIVDRGETPMLHVMTTNVSAIRVYDQLGFTVRREQDVIGLRPPE
jgi:predicted GNAT family acetyltransferase